MNTTPEPLKIDRTKLKTVQNYALLKGISRKTVYTRLEQGLLKKTDIDGVTFIQI